MYENGSCREDFEAFTDDEPTAGVVAAFGVAAKALLVGAVAGINAAFSSLGGESTITAGEEKKFSTVDKLKSYGYGILGGISKFSTGCRQSMDWVGEHLLDYDRPNGEGGKSYRQISQENDARDEASYNKLREKAPCKTAFENSSNISETTLDLASLAMGVYGVKQLVSSGANYLRMNKSYINANISEAAQNSKILKQAINNVSKNSKGITLGSNGGNAGKYVSDVKGEFDALKNIKNGTKVAGSAKAGVSGSIDDMVKACEGGSNPNINRRQALNKAKDSASIPRSQQPTRQWTIGDDITKKGGNYKNYEYSDNITHHGRYYEYDTPQGKKIIVEHTNDLAQGLHTHAGEVPKGANPLMYDFKNPDNRYKPINKDTDHHIRYR